MPNVNKPGTPPGSGQPKLTGERSRQEALVDTTGKHREQVAHHSAGKQAKAAPKGEFMRPHRVHTGADFRNATAKKHAEELADEARKFAMNAEAQAQAALTAGLTEEQQLTGIKFDEERKKRGRRQQEQDSDETQRDSDESEAAKSVGITEGGVGRYFTDMPADRMGDLSLVNPNEIKRQLGPSVRFAQHAMLLAQERIKEGMPRDEVIGFLANLYLGVADRSYANKALKQFGPATGIIDIYPLEVMSHLLQHVPSFLSKVSTAKFFAKAPKGGYKGETNKPIALEYDPELRIRGFAIRGGEKPGYLFEPVDPPGTYHLTFSRPGKFAVMISALSKDGALHIEELDFEIAPGKSEDIESSASMRRAKESVEDIGADGAVEAPKRETSQAGGAPPKPEKDKKKDLTISFKRRI